MNAKVTTEADWLSEALAEAKAKTVYLAGPMRSIPRFNFPAFDAAAADLESRGYKVTSPAAMDREHGFDPATLPEDTDWSAVPSGFSLEDAIRRDYEAILRVDELVLLPGWQRSKGATAEKATAEWRRIPVWEYAPENVLTEADRITTGDRQRDYDHPLPNHERIAAFWRVHLQGKYGIEVPLAADDVAWMMIYLKAARDMHTPKRDNLTDTCGYARCLEKMQSARGVAGYA